MPADMIAAMPQSLPHIQSLAGPWLVCAADADTATVHDCPCKSAGWKSIVLPAAVQQALGADFHGKAWLRRTIDLTDRTSSAERCWLVFNAVASKCSIWLDGEHLGAHTGDYVPFEFEVSSRCHGTSSIEITLLIDQLHAPPPVRDGDLQHGHITKGFHDVLSIQHAGVWDDCFIVTSGPVHVSPDGICITADAGTGSVTVRVAFAPHDATAECRVTIFDPQRCKVTSAHAAVESGQREVVIEAAVTNVQRWRPEEPNLYCLTVEICCGDQQSDVQEVRFGFRTIRTDGHTILLNDSPLFLRGVLHWGHEPRHMAPAPTAGEIRADFAQLRATGINCVCLCMWYPPRRYFEIADEVGMLIWQEHPVWQSSMSDEYLPEYKRHYRAFMRRDANHPSIIIVSATCEHPCYHPELARWWWESARKLLPGKLLQVQTAFFKWGDLERTDLYDEHTYDGSDRWACYVDDVQDELRALPTKPFVMGETVVFSSWPSVSEIHDRVDDQRPWWLPNAFEHMIELERHWSEDHSPGFVERFREQSIRFALLSRKFQVEHFRRHAANAGLVMNHLNDVPAGQFGFRDHVGQWRFDAADLKPWLGDAALILCTPQHKRGFFGSQTIQCEVAVSNFGGTDIDAVATIQVVVDCGADCNHREVVIQTGSTACDQGEVRSARFDLPLPAVRAPTRLAVQARIKSAIHNCWPLWILPAGDMDSHSGTYRLNALPFTEAEHQPDAVERGYSRGNGIETRTWKSLLPDPSALAPLARPWNGCDAVPRACRVLLTHRLTLPIINWLESGGRAILFASKAAGALSATYESLYGQMPLIIERGPLQPGDSEWLLDMLVFDLIRLHSRVIPTEQLGIIDQVDPLIRCVYTHDQKQRVRFFDQLFLARIGSGLLVASSLDHFGDAGQYLLSRLINYMSGDDAHADQSIDSQLQSRFAIDADQTLTA